MQRPAAVVGDEVRDIDQRVDRAQPDGDEPFLQPVRRRAVLHAAHQAECKGRTQFRRLDLDRDRAGKFAFDSLDAGVLELTHVGSGKIARDAVHGGAIGAIGRQVDLDHRIVQPCPVRVVRADRRVVGQIDNAFVIVGHLQLEFRDQHAAALDIADLADAERGILAGDEGARRGENALHARARIRRAANHLDRIAGAGIDHAYPAAGRRWDAASASTTRAMMNGARSFRLVLDALDFEPDHGELVRDLCKRTIGVEVLLEPTEGEFHCRDPKAIVLIVRPPIAERRDRGEAG